MCGIAGAVSEQPLPENRAGAALAALAHRGPDGQGVWRGALGRWSVTLLHTRLAIIDLDARGRQPFEYEKFALSYNGEIYNYRELRADMKAQGAAFKTETDTEVLAAHISRRGVMAGLDGLEGMWAFAALDKADETLWLSRDRFGEKPLLIWRTGGALYFASSVSALAAMAGHWPKVNQGRIARHLVWGYRALHGLNDTAFEGVESLPAGTVLALKGPAPGDARAPEPYWRLEHAPRAMTFEAAAEGVRERLARSVELRMRSDVPAAFCLSGGVDSTALVSMAVRAGHDPQCFSVIDSDERYDESENISVTERALGVSVTRVPVSMQGFREGLTDLTAFHDAPVATISYYVQAKLHEAVAASGCKAAISGTAADELFTGYYDHSLMWLAAMRAELGAEPGANAEFDALADAWRAGYGRFVKNPALSNPLIFIENPGMRGHLAPLADEYAAMLRTPAPPAPSEHAYAESLLHSRMMNELFREVTPLILDQDDRNAMRVSIENRSPFLDRELAEFAYTVPTAHLGQGGVMKSVLREAVRGIAPDAVLDDKRKRGFNASILSVLSPADAQTRAWLLDEGPVFNIVDRAAFETFLGGDLQDNERSKFLFTFASVRAFLDIHSARAAAVSAAPAAV